MDRRPPNPRRLSRQLFKDKPSITPVDVGNTPKYLLGKEVKRTPIRSDIKSITIREGEDFVTYPSIIGPTSFNEWITFSPLRVVNFNYINTYDIDNLNN